MLQRKRWVWLVGIVAAAYVLSWVLYPSDRSPKGAYYRVTSAVNSGNAEQLFPYLETAAQHAAFTIHKYSVDALARVDEAYPPDVARSERLRFAQVAELEPGPGVFAWYAERLGWMDRLRRDLSGVAHVDAKGERATVETVRGTRYAFRRRDNGMWGLTSFTSQLVADAEKAARDYSLIDAAAADYQRAQAQASQPTATVSPP